MNPDSVIFHIPHASTCIPPEYLGDFYENVLTENLRHMTDWYTDELFDFGFGERIVFPVSRLVCDPERFREDEHEPMSRVGMGAVYTQGYDLFPLRKEKALTRRDEILRRFYDPHHEQLEKLSARMLEIAGRCLIIDCHSFSASPLPYEKDKIRPDFCIGTDPYHTPHLLATSLLHSLRDAGYSVVVNRPFSGSIVPLRFYRNDKRVLSIMIEVNRGLYLQGIEKGAEFEELKMIIRRAVERLVEVI